MSSMPGSRPVWLLTLLYKVEVKATRLSLGLLSYMIGRIDDGNQYVKGCKTTPRYTNAYWLQERWKIYWRRSSIWHRKFNYHFHQRQRFGASDKSEAYTKLGQIIFSNYGKYHEKELPLLFLLISFFIKRSTINLTILRSSSAKFRLLKFCDFCDWIVN